MERYDGDYTDKMHHHRARQASRDCHVITFHGCRRVKGYKRVFTGLCPRSLLRPVGSDVISVGVNLCRPHRFARPTEKCPPSLPSRCRPRDSVRERLTACLRDKSGIVSGHIRGAATTTSLRNRVRLFNPWDASSRCQLARLLLSVAARAFATTRWKSSRLRASPRVNDIVDPSHARALDVSSGVCGIGTLRLLKRLKLDILGRNCPLYAKRVGERSNAFAWNIDRLELGSNQVQRSSRFARETWFFLSQFCFRDW